MKGTQKTVVINLIIRILRIISFKLELQNILRIDHRRNSYSSFNSTLTTLSYLWSFGVTRLLFNGIIINFPVIATNYNDSRALQESWSSVG